MTTEEKREFILRAGLMIPKLKQDSNLDPMDRTDAITAMEAASLFVRGNIIRHGVTKLFTLDAARLYRHMANLKYYSAEEQEFFRKVSKVLAGMFPDDKGEGRKKSPERKKR